VKLFIYNPQVPSQKSPRLYTPSAICMIFEVLRAMQKNAVNSYQCLKTRR